MNRVNVADGDRVEMLNRVHVLGGGAALAGRVVVGLVPDQGFDGDVEPLFVQLTVERKHMFSATSPPRG